MKREFTASVYIIDENKALLIYHNKLKKWLPPGGHIEPNETPPEAAIREAYEETGLQIRLSSQENLWIDRWNAKSIERPHLCMLQEIPEHQGIPAHQHIDMAFIGTPVKGELRENHDESSGLRWFSWEEIERLKEDVDIYLETKNVLKTLLAKQEAYA